MFLYRKLTPIKILFYCKHYLNIEKFGPVLANLFLLIIFVLVQKFDNYDFLKFLRFYNLKL